MDSDRKLFDYHNPILFIVWTAWGKEWIVSAC